MNKRIKVATTGQILPGRGILVKLKGLNIALFNVDGAFYAINYHCPHSKGPLAEGRLYGTVVTCPWHGAQFDVVTGKRVSSRPETTDVDTYPVYVENSSIFVEI